MRRKIFIITICLWGLSALLTLPCFASDAASFSASDTSSLSASDAVSAVSTDSPSFWAESFVEAAIGQGLLPEDLCSGWREPITRLDFCRLAANLLASAEGLQNLKTGRDLSGTAAVTFSDCDDPAVTFPDCSDPAVITCAGLGILSGYDDGLFHPEALLTRQQAAVILRNMAECLGMETQVPVWIDSTADSRQPSVWAAEAVWWVMDRGIMAGTGDGCFNPSATFTKEQSVVTLMNLTTPGASEETPARTITTDSDTISVYETVSGSLSQRQYLFEDGTKGVIGRVSGQADSAVLFTAFVGKDAVIRQTDGSVMYVQDGESSFLFILPLQYRLLENNCLEYLPGKDGVLQVYPCGDGYCIRLVAQKVASGCVCDYLAIGAPGRMFDWETEDFDLFSGPHALHGDGRWCWDGYYYICPSTYVPTGENVYYRNSSNYFGTSMSVGLGCHRGCELLCLMMDDTVMLQQNEEGYFPQLNESTWLSGDYGIGAGYYDTRFNSDLMEALMRLYSYNHASNIVPVLRKYLDFYTVHAEAHHRETSSGGWLVEDYSHPAGGTPTHTSLNHQLAETSVLYKAALILGDASLTELADRMLLAIKDTASSWIRSDGNLHYSIYASGSYGGRDYPYLTYNDLYNMQDLLLRLKGSRDSDLQCLMDAKLAWMKENGVRGYLGE